MATATEGFSFRRMINKVIGACVHWVSLNEVELRNATVYKRRNWFGRGVTPLANWFFKACRTPVRFWRKVGAWQRWEVETFCMLNPQYHAEAVGADAIVEDVLPGVAVWDHLKAGTLTVEMLEAAGKELRRAHEMWSEVHKGKWSHGDAATGNVLFDEKTGRARLIDFEVVHQRELPAAARQGDDLHAFVMDLLSFAPRGRWLGLTMAFLRAYGEREALGELRRRLVVPRGMAWVWWKIRANFAAQGMLARRQAKLARAMDQELLSEHARRKLATNERE